MPSSAAAFSSESTVLHPRRRFWLASLVLGIVGCLISRAVFGLIYRGFNLAPAFSELLLSILLAALTLALLDRVQGLLDARQPWTRGIGRRFALQLGLAALCSLLPAMAVVGWLVLRNLAFNAGDFLRMQDLAVVAVVSATLTAVTVLFNLGLFLVNQWRESSLEAERYRKENVEFRFEMLRNQVNPHFLFNSLNTLAGLVYQDPDTASNFTRELARVYRYVLETGERELSPLDQELNFLDAYFYLIKIRFSEGLDLRLEVPDEVRRHQLPPLTLQLLVENAIKHNIVSMSKPLRITVSAEGDTLAVTNTLQPKLVPEMGTHTGLTNIRNRYAYLTDRKIEIINGPDVFSIRLPLLQPDSYA